ncbi:MAG: dihydropteroate synthase [Verrucomicrobiota bacterium]|nr:dihydropteroate synthase [Verrucomicrobiota bacterium]
MILRLPSRVLSFPRRPLVMGIVNVNDDSFSGDGTLDADEALRQAGAQTAAGADIVDLGAESARTNRAAIPAEEECARLRGVLERWGEVTASTGPRDGEQVWPPALSVNTWRSEVVATALGLRAELINDMGGLPDGSNARLVAEHGAALLVMHTAGLPKVEQTGHYWDDVMVELERFFEDKLTVAQSEGLSPDQLVIDPGIDFAKQRGDNLRLMRELDRLQQFERPVLLPVSRKTVIGEVLEIEDPVARDAGTIGLLAAGMASGAQIFRVHNVDAAWQAVKVLAAVETGG